MEGYDRSGGEQRPQTDGDSCRGWRRQPATGSRSWARSGASPAALAAPSGLAARSRRGGPVPRGLCRPMGVWWRRSEPGPLSKPGNGRCLRRGPGLYLAAREGDGAVPGGAAQQRPARRSAGRARPGTLPRAALAPRGPRLHRPARKRRRQEFLPSSSAGSGHGPCRGSGHYAVGGCRSEELRHRPAESWCPARGCPGWRRRDAGASGGGRPGQRGSRLGLHLPDGNAGDTLPTRSLLPSISSYLGFATWGWDCIVWGVCVASQASGLHKQLSPGCPAAYSRPLAPGG